MKTLTTIAFLLIAMTLIGIGLEIGRQEVPAPKKESIFAPENIYSVTVPGTIFISGIVSDSTFELFYEQTLYNLKHYRIILNTDGGSAQACTGVLARIVELQRQGVYITTEVYSKAYSAGAYIWMMGDHRIMHQGSQLMWHTMEGQYLNDRKELPSSYGDDRTEMFELLDANIYRLTQRQMNLVDPMTLETMLLYTGMTFMDADQARELNMLTEYVDN